MSKGVSGAILCGGLNTRMGGQVKGLLQLNGQTFLEGIYASLKPHVSEVMLVSRPDLDLHLSCVRLVCDLYDVRSSLTGIHAALKQADNDFVLVVACDTPLLSPALVRLLVQESDPSYDVIVPRIGGYLEPLTAVYSRACLPYIETLFERKVFKIKSFYSQVSIKVIAEKKIREADPDLYSFLNINTREDYARVCSVLGKDAGDEKGKS